jgi:23S rRNA pseudouridine1911/1915/1917 synthase
MKNQIRVIYQDKNFLALYKPAGLLAHPLKAKNSKLKAEFTLVDWVLKNYPEIKNVGDEPETRPGIVHRLDKDTSGVILVARNQKYFEYLKKLFQAGQIKKTYLALVWGKPEPKTGVIKKPIFLKHGAVKRTVWKGKMEKEAITEYKVLKFFNNFSLVRVMPKTGRTHQIRVHLASIGHPIVGDSLYGPKKLVSGLPKKILNLKRQFLHAQSLEFSPIEGKRIKIEAELPEELKRVIDDLKFKK